MKTFTNRFLTSPGHLPLAIAVAGLAMGTPGLHADDLLTPAQNERARVWSAKGAIAGPGREQALRQLGKLLEPHRATDQDALTLAALLDLSADREAVINDPLVATLERLKKSGAAAVTPAEWAGLRDEIELRVERVLKGLDAGEIDTEAAERLLAIANYAVDAWMGIDKQPPGDAPGGETRRLFAILDRLQGIVSTARGPEDPAAKDLLDGVRDTLAEHRARVAGRKIPSHLQAIEVPAAVSGAIVDHNRKALNEISGVLGHLPRAMQGDRQALDQMLEDTRKVEKTISRDAYGRAMWNALTDRVLDRIPFAGDVVTWFGTDISPAYLTGPGEGTVIWSTSWGKIEIGPGGVRPVEGSFMDRYGGKIDAGYLSGTRLIGSYELTDPAVARRGVFVWHFDTEDRRPGEPPRSFSGHRFQQDPPKSIPDRWSGAR